MNTRFGKVIHRPESQDVVEPGRLDAMLRRKGRIVIYEIGYEIGECDGLGERRLAQTARLRRFASADHAHESPEDALILAQIVRQCFRTFPNAGICCIEPLETQRTAQD